MGLSPQWAARLQWAGRGLCVGSVVFLVLTLREAAATVSWREWGEEVWLWLGSVALVHGAITLLQTAFWRRVVRAYGIALSIPAAWRIISISQVAKYLPGNVLHHVGRVVLAGKAGVPTGAALGSMALETAAVLGVGAVLSFWILFENSPLAGMPWRVGGVLLLLLLAGVMCWRLVKRQGWGTRRWHGALPREFEFLWWLPLVSLCFLPYGPLLGWAGTLVQGAGGALDVGWMTASSAYALGWVAGFLTPGAPGGMGVREMVFVLVLGPLWGNDVAAAVAVLLRAGQMLGDGMVFLSARLLGEEISPPQNGSRAC